jgi:hypothetical protein
METRQEIAMVGFSKVLQRYPWQNPVLTESSSTTHGTGMYRKTLR